VSKKRRGFYSLKKEFGGDDRVKGRRGGEDQPSRAMRGDDQDKVEKSSGGWYHINLKQKGGVFILPKSRKKKKLGGARWTASKK